MPVIYHESDADLQVLAGQTIAVIGYGNLGAAIAQNLRDNDLQVVVSGAESDQTEAAQQDGFQTLEIAAAMQTATVIVLTVTDERLTKLYMDAISPNLRRGHTLVFSSAYTVAFGFVEPPPFVDVVLVAPRTIGDALRRQFTAESGAISYVAVWQDASRSAWETVLAVARGVGSLRAGAMEISIEQEAELSLFIQQAILPAFYHLITKAARLLMDEGYLNEAVFVDLYLSGKFTDFVEQAARTGLLEALQLTGKIGQYGTFSRLERFNDLKLERLLEVTLEDIRSGRFAREWTDEFTDGTPRLNKLSRQHADSDLWDYEQQTLDLLNEDEYL
jgi:ketol-acid reductoisomerase